MSDILIVDDERDIRELIADIRAGPDERARAHAVEHRCGQSVVRLGGRGLLDGFERDEGP